MAPKAKQMISYAKLLQIGKTELSEPNQDLYCHDDMNVVVTSHQKFFEKVAPHTKRLNRVSLGNLAVELFKMSRREASLFGTSMAHAYSHCMLVGGKAKTGEKLAKSVWSVWQASEASAASHAETASSSADPLKTESSAFSPERPAKAIKKCLSSPSQIMALYTGVKVHGVISSALIQKNQEDCLQAVTSSINACTRRTAGLLSLSSSAHQMFHTLICF